MMDGRLSDRQIACSFAAKSDSWQWEKRRRVAVKASVLAGQGRVGYGKILT